MQFSKSRAVLFVLCLALVLALSTARSLEPDRDHHHGHHHHDRHHHHHVRHHGHGHGHGHGHKHSKSFSALYVIGDASVDTGNNNDFPTPYKSNHEPYGRDFPDGPTGRFSNGRLIVDFIASHLGLKDSLPAYNDERTSSRDIQTGVSFGHAGSGLIDSTSQSKNIPVMDQQTDDFDRAVRTMEESVGEERARQIVEDALYLISVGTNDMVDGYYSVESARRYSVSVQTYHNEMLQRLEHLIIERLYRRGARKIVVVGLPPIGCLPTQVTTQSIGNIVRSVFGAQRVCINQDNIDSEGYNTRLQDLISTLNSQYPKIHIEYADIYHPMADLLENPNRYGLERLTEGCCGSGYIEMCNYCSPITPTCPNPERTVFWDAMNPTQAVNAYLAQSIEENVLPKFQS